MEFHEQVATAYDKAIGRAAGLADVLNLRRSRATQRKLTKIRAHALAHDTKSKGLERRLDETEDIMSIEETATLRQEIDLLRRRRDYLYSLCHRVEDRWSDGSAIEFLDQILAGEQSAVEPMDRSTPLNPFLFGEPKQVSISHLERPELWPQRKRCVFLESEFNTLSLQNMVLTRKLFDAEGLHPRLYRRSERDISAQLPSLSRIRYPELLNPSKKLQSEETVDVVLQNPNTRYILILVSTKKSMLTPRSIVLDRTNQTIQKSVYEPYKITRIFDVQDWSEVPDKNIWGTNLKNNVDECPDYACCALAVAW